MIDNTYQDGNERADKPSANKSEDDECEHQFEPFKPGFCICVKCYQVHAVERDEARAALVQKAAPIAVADLASDISADRHFIAGVKLGWNFRDANDEKGFQSCIEGRSKEIREAKAAPPAPSGEVTDKP